MNHPFRIKIIPAALVALFLLATTARAAILLTTVEQNGKLYIDAGGAATVRYDLLTGKFGIFRESGELMVQQAYSSVTPGCEGCRPLTLAGNDSLGWYKEDIADAIGKGTRVVITRKLPDNGMALVNTFSFYQNVPAILIQVGVRNDTSSPIHIAGLTPLEIGARTGAGGDFPEGDGALFLGIDPQRALVFTPSAHREPNLCQSSEKCVSDPNSSYENLLALYDEKAARGLVAGFITQEHATNTIRAYYYLGHDVRDADTGRLGFNTFIADCGYVPPKKIQPGETLLSETLALIPTWSAPYRELEIYSRLSAQISGAAASRAPAIAVWRPPAEGDPWLNFTAALDAAAVKLGPYGLDTFKIGQGWEKTTGDWTPGPAFPAGMAAAAGKIHEKKLRAGITIAPFVADENSGLYISHPEWFLKEDIYTPSQGRKMRILDISQQDVRDWFAALFTRISREWGFDYIEIDAAGYSQPPSARLVSYPPTYQILMPSTRSNDGLTGMAVFRGTMSLIRDAAGAAATIEMADPPFAHIAPSAQVSRVAGYYSSLFIFDDNLGHIQSFLDMARFYYLNGRSRINHPGEISFGELRNRTLGVMYFVSDPANSNQARWLTPRDKDNPLWPALVENENLAWLSAAALFGGAIEISDNLPALSDADADLMRRVMPVYPRGAVPLDIFNQYPVRALNLKVTTDWGKWNVVGLFNWGIDAEKFSLRRFPDAPRGVTVKFDELGLDPKQPLLVYDFWNDEYLGPATGQVELEVPARGVRVVALREALAVPQLLASNRHITSGGVEIPSLSWDAKNLTLSGIIIAAAGFQHRLTFRVPAPYTYASATFENTTANPVPDPRNPELLIFTFAPAASGPIKWRINFKK